MANLTENALSAIRRDFCRRIAKARYTANGVRYEKNIQSITVLPNSTIEVLFVIDALSSAISVITEIALLDQNGQVWASKQTNITISAADGMLYSYQFKISEEELQGG